MEKTLINIIGNICSGKSTLIAQAKTKFPSASFFSIDQYQAKFNSQNADQNETVWLRFISDISKSNFAIVESTGASKYFDLLNSTFKKQKGEVYIVKIYCDKETCHQRFLSRASNKLQISTKFNTKNSIDYIEEKLFEIQEDFEIDGTNQPEVIFNEFMDIFTFESS